jgi:hypothetical protein
MPAKRESKKAYLVRRKRRVRELYLEGYDAPEIARQCVAEGVIETIDESLESAIRLVRADIAEFRRELSAHRAADANPEVAGSEIDALERKLRRLREAHADQRRIATGEPTEICARSRFEIAACTDRTCGATGKHMPFVGPAIGVVITDTPQGAMTSYKALWPAGVRQKAVKDAALLAEKIAELEIVIAVRRAADAASAGGDGADQGGLTIVESDKSIDELIEINLSVN